MTALDSNLNSSDRTRVQNEAEGSRAYQDVNFQQFQQAREASLAGSTASNHLPDFEVTDHVIKKAAHHDAKEMVSDLQTSGFQAASQDYMQDMQSFRNVDPSQHDQSEYARHLARDITHDLLNLFNGTSTDTANGADNNSGTGESSVASGAGKNPAGAANGESGISSGSNANAAGTGSGESSVASGYGSNPISAGSGESSIASGNGSNPTSTGGGDTGVATGSPGQGLYINGALTGMQPEVNMANATDLGTLGNLSGVNTSTGWNSSNGPGGVVEAVASSDNGTFSVTVQNPWNENGHQGSYTEQIPIPDEGLAALEKQASQTNSDGHVLIADTATGTYYDFWLAQNIAPNGQSGGTARTLVQGQLDGNATPGSTASGLTEALADTSVASGTHMLNFDAPTNWMSPGNPGLIAGSTNSDVTGPGGALQEGDVLQLPEAAANAWIAANPNATAAQLQIIKDMESTSVGGGGGMIVSDQNGTGWGGDENAGIWQLGNSASVDMTFLNNASGPNILSSLEVYK